VIRYDGGCCCSFAGTGREVKSAARAARFHSPNAERIFVLSRRDWLSTLLGGAMLSAVRPVVAATQDAAASKQEPRFASGVEVVTISAAVTDAGGRLVTDLAQEEFEVFEDGVQQPITQFTKERVPVSLAVLLDISDSMVGQRTVDARAALDRFLFELLSRDDEFALVLFNHQPTIASGWSSDPATMTPALDALRGWGGTAIYDAVSAAIPLFDKRHRQRAAAVVISDGADTASDISVRELRSKLVRCDAFVYAIGIDREDPRALRTRINPYSLREFTDDTGGYTEVVKDTSELGSATARIAEELNKQYTIGYTPGRTPDSQFHGIRVRVKRPNLRVRARRGYIATPGKKRG
jgi:VWFA-related protein